MKTFFAMIPDPLLRLLIVFAVLLGGALLVRASLPPSLKDSAIHERTTSERETARPIHYSGSGACGECHAEAEAKRKGYHRNLSCETCHGPAQAHIDSSEVKPNLPKLREFCVRCHAYDPSTADRVPPDQSVAPQSAEGVHLLSQPA